MTVVSGSLSKTHDARTESKAGNSRQSSVPRMLVIETLRIYDIGAFALAGTLGYTFYVVPNPANINRYPGTIILVSLVAATMCHVCGAYRDRAVFSRSLGARQAIFGWLVAFALVVVAAFALKVSESYSRGWAGIWLVSATGFLLVGRYLLSVWTVRLAQRGAFAYRTLIVGTGSQAARLAAHIKARGDVRTQIVGFVDYQRLDGKSDGSFHGFPLVANLNDMMALIRSNACNEVIIALPWAEEKQIEQLTLLLAMAPVRIRLAPDLAGFNFADRHMTSRAGVPMLTLFDRPISGWSGVVKGIEDQAVALVALVLLVPVMLAVAVAVKIESSGPILFRQRRLGLNNNLFEVWKFRTMRWECTDADAIRQTTKDDPRVTRLGRFLRRWSLDELPQLFNVLRGEMSIVGPRPHAVATKAGGKLFQDVVDRYAARHRVKPGITGWAQVNGWRGETSTIDKIRTRVDFDLYYIDNWSVWFDIYIIGRTFGALFRADRAY